MIISDSLCPFCQPQNSQNILLETQDCRAILDSFPVAPGHALIIPRRHLASYFDLPPEEQQLLWAMVNECKKYLQEHYHPDGFNIGINIGDAAGQTIPHVHIHLIPRYTGDTPKPKGGVRGVIPGKQSY